MKITEKHLQDIFDEIEVDAAVKDVNEGRGMILAALKMQNLLMLVLKVGSEEEFMLYREHAKECVRMLQLGDGDITVSKYDCGHPINPIIIDTDEFTLTTYMEWKHDNSGLCLECWLKRRKEK